MIASKFTILNGLLRISLDENRKKASLREILSDMRINA